MMETISTNFAIILLLCNFSYSVCALQVKNKQSLSHVVTSSLCMGGFLGAWVPSVAQMLTR